MPSRVITFTSNDGEARFVHRLAASLAKSHEAFGVFCVYRGRDYIFLHGQPPAVDELDKWNIFNAETAKLIEENRSLWEELPGPLADFLEYHTSCVAQLAASKDPTQAYLVHSGLGFPRSINTWVLEKLRDLMRGVAASSVPRSRGVGRR
jgi:hypothetical protein